MSVAGWTCFDRGDYECYGAGRKTCLSSLPGVVTKHIAHQACSYIWSVRAVLENSGHEADSVRAMLEDSRHSVELAKQIAHHVGCFHCKLCFFWGTHTLNSVCVALQCRHQHMCSLHNTRLCSLHVSRSPQLLVACETDAVWRGHMHGFHGQCLHAVARCFVIERFSMCSSGAQMG